MNKEVRLTRKLICSEKMVRMTLPWFLAGSDFKLSLKEEGGEEEEEEVKAPEIKATLR